METLTWRKLIGNDDVLRLTAKQAARGNDCLQYVSRATSPANRRQCATY
jgi:hypothetical protein